MCGIAGIVNLDKSEVSSNLLKKMTDLVKHRGPDGEGCFTIDNIGLGHRRLSIIDLTELGMQPMHYLDRYSIVFNGEIYNYLEIREELIKLGYKFKSKSDTEVILASYNNWGEKCVTYFNGMWAFALYDREEKKLFCSRDRFGVKPFYYTLNNNKFLFGSEIKQILKCSEISPIANSQIVSQYLVNNFSDHTNETFFQNINKLPPSHNLVFDLRTNEFQINRYYSLEKKSEYENISLNEAKEGFESLFQSSVNLRLRSDVKVGSCLSGGLDSSSIVGVASKIYTNTNAKFSAITAQVDGRYDETEYAKSVVDFCDLNWYKVKPTQHDFTNEIDTVIQLQEEPFLSPSIYLQYKVMEAARKNNIPVLLDGQGGDETMLGYTRYLPSYIKAIPFFSRFKAMQNAKINFNLSYKYLIQNNLYFSNYSIRKNRLLFLANSIGLDKKVTKDIDWSWIMKYADATKDVFSLQKIEIENTILPLLLRFEDKNSMAHGVETRLPFLDYRLVEFNLSISSSYKIAQGYSKFILRNAMSDKLPKDIVWRKNKFSFAPSDEMWMSNTNVQQTILKSSLLRSLCNKELSHLAQNSMLRWRLFNLAKWSEIFLENT